MKTIMFRLKPGADLKSSIEKVVQQHTIQAGFILTCVGGLEQATVRMAGATPNAQDIRTFKDDFEIVSLVGTVSVNGTHLHMSFSDREGTVLGGHLKEGTIIHPTAEIVLGFDENSVMVREMDKQTGFAELVMHTPSSVASVKTVKFRDYLVPLVLSGEKNSTWRLFDDKDLSVGDNIELREFGKDLSFATAKITKVIEKPFKNLTEDDKRGHETFSTNEEMYKIYSGYYNTPVGPDSAVKIIWFELLKRL